MKDAIIRFRSFLLKHIKNKQLQTLIWGLISYEMISYVLFGVGTVVIDYSVFSFITAMGLNALISNIISTLCAIIFAYFTNKLWVFKSKTNGFIEIIREFFRFANVRFATLLMTEVMLFMSQLLNGNDYIVKLIAMLLTVILNYVFSKLFIFTKRKGSK
ncbi:MAG: GtrA family protein [Eubacterium sp.]